MNYNLFLDDVREVKTIYPDRVNEHWIVVKNYEEFVQTVELNGIPKFISFDHDLGEKLTGYDCAKWLVYQRYYIYDFSVHSSNVPGKENIQKYLDNWKKFLDNYVLLKLADYSRQIKKLETEIRRNYNIGEETNYVVKDKQLYFLYEKDKYVETLEEYNNQPGFVTIAEFSKLTKVHVTTVKDRISVGTYPYRRMLYRGRVFSFIDINELVEVYGKYNMLGTQLNQFQKTLDDFKKEIK